MALLVDEVSNTNYKEASLLETVARRIVASFLASYISTGCLILHEANGSKLRFDGSHDECSFKVDLHVHNPQFYWKIMTRADIGLADAYIDGDFSVMDSDRGLFNLFMGNDVFALFLDETMSYSCGIFKRGDEDLKTAQMRKISILVEKARIEKKHHVLEIGCGWGSFGIEVVKRRGCKYTGITLSQEQLDYAQLKVKQAGLEDNITLMLCDYRQLPTSHQYDRIISCEMIEHVGDEYMDGFFGCCESLLAQNGLFVLQFSSIADGDYDEHRRSPGFMKDYIFPGGLLPSLSRVIYAMKNSSKLSVEHVENIGSHYCRTLNIWRKNLLANKSKIMGLGLDEKFIRTLEYYFDYCCSGFKTSMLGNYQVVFSRPGNHEALGDPYKGFPSAYQ